MIPAARAFGPWTTGIDPAERLARLRSLRAIVRLSLGGLWIAHSQASNAEEMSSLSFGEANFWQTDPTAVGRRVRCHGPNGIYSRLVPQVAQRFA